MLDDGGRCPGCWEWIGLEEWDNCPNCGCDLTEFREVPDDPDAVTDDDGCSDD